MSAAWLGVPAKFAAWLDAGCELEGTTAMRAARAWLDSDAQWLVLVGDTGSGKTLAASWILAEQFRRAMQSEPWSDARRRTGLFVQATELGNVWPDSDTMRAWQAEHLLVLNDLGIEPSEGNDGRKAADNFAALTNIRHETNKRTVITMNATATRGMEPHQADKARREAFALRYGARLVSRIRESGLDERGKARWWVNCNEDDMRGRVQPKMPERPPERPPEPEVPEEEGIRDLAKMFLRLVEAKEAP